MIILNRMLEMLLFPPGLTLLLGLMGVLLLRRWRRLGVGLILAGLFALYLISIPRTADLLIEALESAYPPLDLPALRQSGAEAVVVLGSGRYPRAPEYGGRDTLSTGGLSRVRYGAWVHRGTGLPILVTGGAPYGEEVSEASLMKRVLEEEFQVPVRWSEELSRNTEENALFSAALLAQAGIKRVLVVTHALHMRRAMALFAGAGVTAVAAPTLFRVRSQEERFADWLPGDGTMARVALHEYFGYAWYRVKRAF